MDSSIPLPDQVPVMPLPGALLFPNALLPLHIFEPRYRRCSNMPSTSIVCFRVALVKPQREQWKSTDDFFHVAGVGLIRACVGRERWNFELDPARAAPRPIHRVRTGRPLSRSHGSSRSSRESTSSVETDALAAKVIELYSTLKSAGRRLPEKVDRYLADLSDMEMLADLMAATFINDPLRRQQLLEELPSTSGCVS